MFEGARFVIRKEPAFIPMQDHLDQVVIAPRKDLAEVVQEITFENVAVLGFEVTVIVLTLPSWDEAELRRRMEIRDAIRLAMWKPAPFSGLSTEFDVDYDPSPAIAVPPGSDNVDVVAQKFTYYAAVARSS